MDDDKQRALGRRIESNRAAVRQRRDYAHGRPIRGSRFGRDPDRLIRFRFGTWVSVAYHVGALLKSTGPESSGKTTLDVRGGGASTKAGRYGCLHRRRARARPAICGKNWG